jgi:Flp pilus assembly protein protease CpaA
MQEYYFLFAIAMLWTVFATIQDIKKREVSNWLNFSLIAFALAYRAFYSALTKNINFFLLGLLGFGIFFGLANLFYYSKTFAGGDAKLLMGFGVILPYANYRELISLSIFFLFFLFLVGAVYSLIYSVFIAAKNRKQFKTEFARLTKKYKRILSAASVSFVILLFLLLIFSLINYLIFILIFFILSAFPWLYIYTQALDKCMVSLVPAEKLTEGDWLEQDIKINSKLTIKKTVHGLSFEDIQLLKKYKKPALIKQGIPFVPAFLIALLITALVFLTSEFPQVLSFFG